MSKNIKIWLIIAAILVAFGFSLFAGVMTAYDWDFSRLDTITFMAGGALAQIPGL